MAKVLKALATALGSGIALGLGIQLGRNAAGSSDVRRDQSLDRVLDRINNIEGRLSGLDPAFAAPVDEHIQQSNAPDQMSDVADLRAALDSVNGRLERLAADSEQWKEQAELAIRKVADEAVTARTATLAEQIESALTKRQMAAAEALADAIESRLADRMTKLEQDVHGQSASIEGLRECSLQTERSLQRLLEGLDRLVTSQQAPAQSVSESTSETKVRPWKLFT